MRVLLAASQGGANGIEAYTQRLQAGLAHYGVKPLVASRSPSAEFPLPATVWPIRRALGPMESWRTHAAIRAGVVSSFDVVHATYPEFAPSSCPTVVTAWHPGTSVRGRLRSMRHHGERGKWSGALFAYTDRMAYDRTTHIVAVTREVQRALTRTGRASEWVPPFVGDDEVLEPRAGRDRTCVMVSRWLDEPRKGLPVAIEAVARARARGHDLRLVLVGEFRDPRTAAVLPDFCNTLGAQKRDRVMQELAVAGCAVMPSAWEEFGYVGIEALASGAPLVVTDLPAFEGVACDGLFLVRGADPGAWASAIVEATSVRSFTFPPEFRSSTAVPKLIDIYERAASRVHI